MSFSKKNSVSKKTVDDSKKGFNMDFKAHGRGFLLVPEEGHPDWGTKYYHNGWWMPKYNAWFFKKTDKESLLKTFTQVKNENKKSAVKVSKDTVVKEYGKGYLLVPEEGHPDWGTKYYHNGWWMPKHNAWFFKKEYVADLIVDCKKDTEDKMFKGFKMQKYGKGYLLTVDKNHPDWGEKYYYNGWWFSKQKGWFFKKEWKTFLIDNGVKMSKKSFKDETLTFDCFKMESYGKGLILTTPSKYNQWGEKYYYGGWWFPKQKGWFFKKDFEQFLKDNGATY